MSEAVGMRPDDRGAGIRRRTPSAMAARRFVQSRSALVGTAVLLLIVLSAVLAPSLSPYDPLRITPGRELETPSVQHPMGTDRFGRDMLARVLWGGRSTLPVGLVSVSIAATVGVSFGLLAGYRGSRIDAVIMRIVDLMLAFPGILLALFIIAILGGSLLNLMIAVGIASIPDYVRLTRGMVLSAKEQEFVLAARALGYREANIMFRHILPNVLAPIVVMATLRIAGAIITASALSFLGLGVQPPTPEWGKMLAEGQEFIAYAWWVTFFPGLAIMLTVFSINLLGDGLRDALDPRLRLRTAMPEGAK
jgi:ABC-type dipeptide/oligopeptide/nickel transport system permease subunit